MARGTMPYRLAPADLCTSGRGWEGDEWSEVLGSFIGVEGNGEDRRGKILQRSGLLIQSPGEGSAVSQVDQHVPDDHARGTRARQVQHTPVHVHNVPVQVADRL